MNNKLLLMLPTIIKAEPTSDSDHQEHLTILIASGKQRKWFDKISLMIKSRDFLRKMLRSTSRDVRPHYQHGLVMVMWKRFSNSYARHWLIFSLLMKVNFSRTWIKTSWLRENLVLLSADWVWTMESTWQA